MPELQLPKHFEPSRVGEVWRVPYQERAREARAWAHKHTLAPAAEDSFRLCLLAVDLQNTFCIPDFELFVAGRSGRGAVEDNRRLCEFIYGNHPAPYTLVSAEEVKGGRWRMNPAVAEALGIDFDYAERHLAHYTRSLAEGGKYNLTIWPYHAMLGSIGHALVSAVEEAIFFHSIARHSQPEFQVKGNNPLTEHYSMLGPEVSEGADGDRLGGKNIELIEKLLTFDAVVVGGQAKSHCMAWTIDDLLEEEAAGERLAERTYLLEDCTSAVVVPGVVDYTDEADAAFERYAGAGMHVVRSDEPIESWPGLAERRGA